MIPAKVKDSLVQLLPDCDTHSHETISGLFTNPEFINSLLLFQRHLHSGTFDTVDATNRKVRKVQEVQPWKVRVITTTKTNARRSLNNLFM